MAEMFRISEEVRAKLERMRSMRIGAYASGSPSSSYYRNQSSYHLRSSSRSLPPSPRQAARTRKPVPKSRNPTIHIAALTPERINMGTAAHDPRAKEMANEKCFGEALDSLLNAVSRGNKAKKAAAEMLLRAIADDVSNNFLADYVRKYNLAEESYMKIRGSPLAALTQNLANMAEEIIGEGKEVMREIARRTQQIIEAPGTSFNPAFER